jgi:hypothetical protein
MAPPPRATRKISPLLRAMISAVLLAFAIFVTVYRKSLPPERSEPPTAAASKNKPFLSKAPSSEGANRFAWIPSFPGAELHDINTKQTRDLLSYGFSFHTTREFKEVLAFYGERLQAQGFKVDVKDNAETGGELHADAADGSRSFDVVAAKTAAGAGTGAEIGVTAVQR